MILVNIYICTVHGHTHNTGQTKDMHQKQMEPKSNSQLTNASQGKICKVWAEFFSPDMLD